jgi:hypothetical protein
MRIAPPTGTGVIFEWHLAFKVIGVIEVSGNRLTSAPGAVGVA